MSEDQRNSSLTYQLNDINIQFEDQTSNRSAQRPNQYTVPEPVQDEVVFEKTKASSQSKYAEFSRQSTIAEPSSSHSVETAVHSSSFDNQSSSHAKLNIFTILNKALIVLCYFFLDLSIRDHIITFVIILLLVSIDFWITQNITGRRLVGLRWWNQFREVGDEVIEEWKFQSVEPGRKLNTIDESIFWFSQISIALFFIIYTIVDTFSLELFWGTLSLCSAILTCVNLWGFYKCNGEHKKKVKQWTANAGLNIISKSI